MHLSVSRRRQAVDDQAHDPREQAPHRDESLTIHGARHGQYRRFVPPKCGSALPFTPSVWFTKSP